ncbi:MAG: PspC domain-containing protein [Candidatus Paceibacterota bacterium]|jgi:phage shock protein C
MVNNNIKKMHRSSTDKIIFGVCGGIAEYLEVDSLAIRIIFLFLAFVGGSGIFVYLILALLMPKELNEKKDISESSKEMNEDLMQSAKEKRFIMCFRNFAGIIIVLMGLSFLFKEIFEVALFGWLQWKTIMALVIILFGISIIKNQSK